MTTIKDHLGNKDSGRVGTLIDRINKQEFKLLLRRDNSEYLKFIPVIVNSKGKQDSIRLQFSVDTPLEIFQDRFQSYLEIDNPGMFQVVLNYSTSPSKNIHISHIHKPKTISHNFQIGDIVAIKMRSGDRINRGMVVVGFTTNNELIVYPLLKKAMDYADYIEAGQQYSQQTEIFNPEHTVKDSTYFIKKGYDTEKIRQKAKQIRI